MSHSRLRLSAKSRFRAQLFLAFLAGCFFLLLLVVLKTRWAPVVAGAEPLQDQRGDSIRAYTISRIKGYENVTPLLSIDRVKESTRLKPLKEEVTRIIDSLKQAGFLEEASVYFKELDRGAWISVNANAQYHPASLMKVCLLIGYLKIAQSDPALLRQKWVFNKPDSVQINPQYYQAPSIQPGKAYTLHDLLYHMVAYSDNNATWLLASHFDNRLLKKIFADLGLPEPVDNESAFTMTALDYSIFYKVIYNSGYLSAEFSEYAAELLSHSTFQEGFGQAFPKGTKMYRKFGEWRLSGQDYELHESGVFFIKNTPFLLTVMTRGKDTPRMAGAIRAISKKVYEMVSPP